MDGSTPIIRALGLARKQDCDALLVTGETMRYYLTGFRSSFGYLLLTARESVLYLDGRYVELARRSLSPLDFKIEVLQTDLVVRGMKKASVSFLGLDCAPGLLGKKMHVELSHVSACKQVDLGELREVKTADEVEVISEACVLTDDTFALFRTGIRLGMDETDLHFLWRRAMLEAGGLEKAFDPIIAVNSGSSYPHYMLMGEERVTEGSIILVDAGVDASGYKSDMTRMVFLPRAPAQIVECYAKIRDVQEKVLSSIKPGVNMMTTAQLCEDLLEGHGLGGRMVHALGHGVGLEVHEEPFYQKDSGKVWREDMVITVEPGAYFPGEFGIRIEDTVVVKNDGIVSLTRTPKDLQNAFLTIQ